MDGVQLIDLTETIFNKTIQIKIVRSVTVTSEFEGRPSYLSKVVLGDSNLLDLLCTVNGISNPLTIQAGMVLLVPDVTSLQDSVTDLNADSNVQNNQAMQALNAKYNPKYNNTDPARTAMLSGNNTALRTPNMTPPNTVPVIVDGAGSIILGTNTSTSRCKSTLTDAQTKTEVIRNAVRTNLLTAAITQATSTQANITISLQANGTVVSSQTAVQATLNTIATNIQSS